MDNHDEVKRALLAAEEILLEENEEEELKTGTRVWVWDPFLFGKQTFPGKIIETRIKARRKGRSKLESETAIEYYVYFGPKYGFRWIESYQVAGWLHLV